MLLVFIVNGSINNNKWEISEDLRGETMVSPSKKLDDLIHLAELCVDLLQQNEEHYAEVGILTILHLLFYLLIIKSIIHDLLDEYCTGAA